MFNRTPVHEIPDSPREGESTPFTTRSEISPETVVIAPSAMRERSGSLRQPLNSTTAAPR